MNAKRNDSMERLFDEKPASDYLGLSVRTLQTWRLKGGGPVFCKLGSRVKYRLSDLDDFIRARTMAHTSEAAK